jgi:peroxiredoxin
MAMPAVEAWQQGLGPRGLAVISVTDDPVDAVRRWITRSTVSYAVAHDPGAKVGAAYWVSALPTFFIIDSSGNIAHAAEGWEPTQRASIEGVIQRLLGQSTP